MMMQPKLLILDEPTLGLAPVILEQLSKEMERLRRTTSITVLLGEQKITFALPCRPGIRARPRPHHMGRGPGRFAREMGTGHL